MTERETLDQEIYVLGRILRDDKAGLKSERTSVGDRMLLRLQNRSPNSVERKADGATRRPCGGEVSPMIGTIPSGISGALIAEPKQEQVQQIQGGPSQGRS